MICRRLHVYTLYILRIIQNFPLSPMNKQDEETKGILNPTRLNTYRYIETKEGFYLQQIYMYLLVQSIMLSFQKQTALISLTQNSSETNKTWTCNDFIIDNNGQKVILTTQKMMVMIMTMRMILNSLRRNYNTLRFSKIWNSIQFVMHNTWIDVNVLTQYLCVVSLAGFKNGFVFLFVFLNHRT